MTRAENENIEGEPQGSPFLLWVVLSPHGPNSTPAEAEPHLTLGPSPVPKNRRGERGLGE